MLAGPGIYEEVIFKFSAPTPRLFVPAPGRTGKGRRNRETAGERGEKAGNVWKEYKSSRGTAGKREVGREKKKEEERRERRS